MEVCSQDHGSGTNRLKYIYIAIRIESNQFVMQFSLFCLSFNFLFGYPNVHSIYNCILQSLWRMFRISLDNTNGIYNCSVLWRQFSWCCSRGRNIIWHNRPDPMKSYCIHVRVCLRTNKTNGNERFSKYNITWINSPIYLATVIVDYSGTNPGSRPNRLNRTQMVLYSEDLSLAIGRVCSTSLGSLHHISLLGSRLKNRIKLN